MRSLPPMLLAILLCGCSTVSSRASAAHDTPPPHVFDASTPLQDRNGPAPKAFFEMLQLRDATSHTLTDSERHKLAAALGHLTPLQRRVLTRHLRSISFVEGMPNNALTYPDETDRSEKRFHITIRAGVLNETVSELITRKERSCADAAGSSLELSIDAGHMDALVYILLHEATHIVDNSLGFTAEVGARYAPTKPFTEGIWEDRLHAVAAYRSDILDTTCWRERGKTVPLDKTPSVYTALSQTPFASLYGSNNWHDDIAELVAWYTLTQVLHQPYRIELRDQGNLVYSYEPMNSPLVRSRFVYLQQFFAG
ncbi:hypothetical protein POL68_20145 [Stigmatella sp. ncwal1]|uniref:Secreted protein n=1 Tax=Stigmatella ashevillensis TaxID=2995309 RepID=A0ABT5DAX8_9BACT|nr:hypothetical protein [Stigmatella ashevillena]MDC0710798.1 hypothetical protein [Stigmatella ashevillena]